MAGDPYWNSVVLAMPMDGANTSTVFTDLKGHAMTAAGTAQISTAQSKFGGASAVFGTSTANKVTAAASTDFALGGAPFTIEMQVYQTATNASGAILVSCGGGANGWSATTGFHWRFYIVPSNFVMDWWNGVGQIAVGSGAGITLNTWTHVAASFDGTSLRLFVGGTLMATVLTNVTAPSTVPSLAFGENVGATAGATNVFTGYIDDVRITKGVCRYTTTFTPPAATFPNAPAQISGTVKDTTGTLGPRAVRVYRKSDGALSGATTSHSTSGAFAVPALDASAHYAIVHDTDADPYWPNVVLASHFNSDSVVDPYASSVVLGLHFEGANASTVFTDVAGKTLTAAGTAAISTDTARFGNSSGKFGTSTANKVTAAASADFALGTNGLFTIEFQTYPTADNASGGYMLSAGGGVNAWNTTTGWHWAIIRNASGCNLQVWVSGTTGVTSTRVACALNTWTHVAFAFDGTSIYAFSAGVLIGTTTSATASPSTTPTLAIGELVGSTAGATNVFTGYIDDLRITKGVCRYTSTFTPPSVPFGSFKDLTGKDLMIAGTPSINTTTKKYGDGALALSGSARYLSIAQTSALDFGTADVTIECWFYIAGASAADGAGMRRAGLIGSEGATTTFFSIRIDGDATNTNNGIGFESAYAGSALSSSVAMTISGTTWHHLAMSRSAGCMRFYYDGMLVLVTAFSQGLSFGAYPVRVGACNGIPTWERYLNGYIDDLRITKGVARYVADFTPPERAFPGPVSAGTANALIYDDLTPV